ncbi:unnamed protein product [Rotaria sp. Silwood1]|nr:unnamed protein product [Rotaria sp. Silwood1]
MSSINEISEVYALVPHVKQTKATWAELVKREVKNGKLKVAACAVYSKKEENNVQPNAQCICGRIAREHSFNGDPKIKFRGAQKWLPKLTIETDVTHYGQSKSGARFIRCDVEKNTFETLFQIICDDVVNKPKLIVSCYGGAQYFSMTDILEREFMNGIGQVATTKGQSNISNLKTKYILIVYLDVWILTTGLNSGVSHLIGQGIHRNTLLNENTWKPIVIGMSHWGTISKSTREALKQQAPSNRSTDSQHTLTFCSENERNSLDKHHTHFLLLDDGRLNHYLGDDPRSKFVKTICNQTKCYAVTIIVEGGWNTLEVIQHDLDAERPVVIIHGSGRLANVLGNLLEKIRKIDTVTKNDVKKELDLCSSLYCFDQANEEQDIEMIQKVLAPKYRRYLSVFKLDRDVSLTNTIFRAVLDTQNDKEDYKELLELAVTWNCLDGAIDIFERIKSSKVGSSNVNIQDGVRKYYPNLFEKALKENRPLFVDYFLRQYYSPLETTAFVNYRDKEESNSTTISSENYDFEEKNCVRYALEFIVEILYKNNDKESILTHPVPRSLLELDDLYFKLIGPYAKSFYRRKKRTLKRFCEGLSTFCYPSPRTVLKLNGAESETEILLQIVSQIPLPSVYECEMTYGKQEMLRDIFLWSVYKGYIDMAFVLLLQIKSRISAALVAASMAHRLSLMSHNSYLRSIYMEHRTALEEYATACIDICYKHNERVACELISREIPLFGNITCMQAAIASDNIPFVNTECFDQFLHQQWYGHLDSASIKTIWEILKFALHVASFGMFAPIYLNFRLVDKSQKKV